MTENRWADAAGLAGPPPAAWNAPAALPAPPRVRYRILDRTSGLPVERKTTLAFDAGRQRYYHGLAPVDQHYADAIVALIQQACSYFGREWTPLEGVSDVVVSDDDVRERIARIDQGENTREAERSRLQRYPICDLPWDQQRALVEQIERVKRECGFEIIGEEPPRTTPDPDPPIDPDYRQILEDLY